MPRKVLAPALLAAVLCACGGSPTGPTSSGTDCPPDKTYFYCSSQGYACATDDDCCGSLTCDRRTGACTDGGLTGVSSGFRCSPDSPCVSQETVNGKTDRVDCVGGICEWLDAQRAYCSDFSQACNRDSDCCGKLWCDRSAGLCTDGQGTVASGYRCSNQTRCAASELIGGKFRPLFCDGDGICKYEPYCAE